MPRRLRRTSGGGRGLTEALRRRSGAEVGWRGSAASEARRRRGLRCSKVCTGRTREVRRTRRRRESKRERADRGLTAALLRRRRNRGGEICGEFRGKRRKGIRRGGCRRLLKGTGGRRHGARVGAAWPAEAVGRKSSARVAARGRRRSASLPSGTGLSAPGRRADGLGRESALGRRLAGPAG